MNPLIIVNGFIRSPCTKPWNPSICLLRNPALSTSENNDKALVRCFLQSLCPEQAMNLDNNGSFMLLKIASVFSGPHIKSHVSHIL